jgi:hypothetical protein
MSNKDSIAFSVRTGRWYDLTSRCRKQLFDLDKKDYLKFKTKEHMNQVILQRQIGTGLQLVPLTLQNLE